MICRLKREQHVDPSMVYDYSGIYDAVQQLRTIPVTLRDIISMGVTPRLQARRKGD